MNILYINRSSSKCGACNHSAFPQENSHITRGGLGPDRKGCGVVWDGVSSEYMGQAEQMLETTFGFENLRGLPVYHYFGEQLGVYGGTSEPNEALSEVQEDDDCTIYESEDLR